MLQTPRCGLICYLASAFSIADVRVQAAAPRDIDTRNLHDEACTRFRETAYRTVLPPVKVPFLTRPLEQMTSETLTPQEVFLISRINGAWDLKSIIDISPLGEIDALRVMKRLKERGLIDLR